VVLHLAQQGGEALGLGDKGGRSHVVADRITAVTFVLGPDEVLGIGDAHHVVDVVEVDRQSATPGGQSLFEPGADRSAGLEGSPCQAGAP